MPILPTFPTRAIPATRVAGPAGRAAGAVRCAAVLAALLAAAPAAGSPQLAERGPSVERLVSAMEAKSPFFRIIFEDHPHERPAFIKLLKAARRFGGVASMRAAAREFGQRAGWTYLPFYIARANDAAVVGYGRLMADTVAAIRARSHEACYAYLAGTRQARNETLATLSAAHKARMARTVLALVLGSREGARPRRVHPDAYRAPLQAVLSRVADRLGRGNLVQWRAGLIGRDRAKSCDFAAMFFAEVVKRPAAEAALILRAILAE